MTQARFFRSLAVALLSVSLLPSAASAQVGTFDAFYVFGDSLADNGNVWLTSKLLGIEPAPPPSESPNLTYFQGRFSNGPVAFEYLWNRLRQGTSVGPLRPYLATAFKPGGNPAVNFAFGGTGTPLLDQTPGGLWAPGLLGQVELFSVSLGGRKPSRNALYAIVSGANDYGTDPYNRPMSPATVVANIISAVKRLHKLGARDILVLTLPNLGCTPSAGAPASCIDDALPPADGVPDNPSELSALHNALLAAELARLNLGPRVRLVDVNVVFASLRQALGPAWPLPAIDVLIPTPIALPDGTLAPMSACLFVNPALCTDVPAWSRQADGTFATPFPLLFWDIVHPTTDAHRALGDYLYAALRR